MMVCVAVHVTIVSPALVLVPQCGTIAPLPTLPGVDVAMAALLVQDQFSCVIRRNKNGLCCC